MQTDPRSFTAASSFPYKIFRNTDLVASLNSGIVRPTHLQVIPTNRCNLNCSFCSCKDRNKKDELDLGLLCDSLCKFSKLGVKSITITGGGEPLMYPHIGGVVDCAVRCGMKVGLVTNGLLLSGLHDYYINQLTWCRVSFSDERGTGGFEDIITRAVTASPDVDWAFSYVVTKNYDRDKLEFIIDLANRLNFTHVRVVSDLIDLNGCEPMDEVKESIRVDDSRVIYQSRQDYTIGQNPCYISLLKPVLGADGKVYPCCGAQYAINGEKLDLVRQMGMGTIEEFPSLVADQMFFDGTICDKCYYSEYNKALGATLSPMKHLEFV